ncbi:MAG TPA: hypothetical protein VFZ53_31365 [Polyangiaceae bacterium]
MKRRAFSSLVLAFATCAETARADAADPGKTEAVHQPADASDPARAVSVWTSLRAGVVEAPYPSETLTEARSGAGQARLVRFGVAACVASDVSAGAHAAYVFAGVEQPAGSYRAAGVFGNPILFATLSRSDLWSAFGSAIHGALSLSFGIPVAAERGEVYEQLDRRALAIGDALEGRTNPEIFTPNTLPLAASGSLSLPLDQFDVGSSFELPFLVRLSDDTVPNGAATSAVGFVPNAELYATAWPWSWLGLTLGSTLAWPVIEPVYLANRTSTPQLTLVPRVSFAVSRAVLLALDAAVAAGGHASGTSGAFSARLSM